MNKENLFLIIGFIVIVFVSLVLWQSYSNPMNKLLRTQATQGSTKAK
jgi:sensor domain CHASE-containing protein